MGRQSTARQSFVNAVEIERAKIIANVMRKIWPHAKIKVIDKIRKSGTKIAAENIKITWDDQTTLWVIVALGNRKLFLSEQRFVNVHGDAVKIFSSVDDFKEFLSL